MSTLLSPSSPPQPASSAAAASTSITLRIIRTSFNRSATTISAHDDQEAATPLVISAALAVAALPLPRTETGAATRVQLARGKAVRPDIVQNRIPFRQAQDRDAAYARRHYGVRTFLLETAARDRGALHGQPQLPVRLRHLRARRADSSCTSSPGCAPLRRRPARRHPPAGVAAPDVPPHRRAELDRDRDRARRRHPTPT